MLCIRGRISLTEFRPVGPLESWAYGIAYLEFRNACRRNLRSRLRSSPLIDDTPAAPVVPPDPTGGLGDDVEEAVNRLDDEDALVMRLRHEAGLSFEEIGRRLSMPMNTAKTRYHRGLKRLREWMRVRESQREHPR